MYNHLYKYLKENNILYKTQFGFQSGYSTNDTIVHLVDKMLDSFEKEQFTLGVFIGLSVDHSILEPLLFLVYVNDLPNASHLLDPIMFADDTNLFFNHKDIKHLFTVVNNEIVNIKDWFTANKLSLNVEKTKYFFFLLHLPKFIINNYEIQSEESIKFLGVSLDQHITWKEHKTY